MSSISKLVLAFVTLILGIVFAAQVADIGQDITTTIGVSNETVSYVAKMDGIGEVNESAANITVANAPTSWKVDDCPITDVKVSNASGTELTLDTDYQLVASTGTIAILNTTDTNSTNNIGNTTLVNYNYCGDDYMNLGWGRTGIDLVPGFFALALLLTSVALFYSVAKENGVMN